MRRHNADPPPENTLLGDLESIRALLEETRDEGAGRSAGNTVDDTGDVPMLDDVVEGALTVDESPLESRRPFEDGLDSPSALADDAIEALMGDAWRASADKIIRDAREALEAASARWSATEGESLEATLRTRIDRALQDWMSEITLNNIDALRERLLDAIDAEVRNITEQLSQGSHGE